MDGIVEPTAGRCRACQRGALRHVLSLGSTPLANALRSPEQLHTPEARFPLEVGFCSECSLVQILQIVPPDAMFRDYCYFSSTSETMVRHAEALARRTITERRLDSRSLVLEAASNDGYLLKNYLQAGISVLGVEPAHNLARIARDWHGIPTRDDYFGADVAREFAMENKRVDVFHAHNVLAHVPDLNGFVEGIRIILKQDGVAIIEVPYVKDMLDRCEFDTIYHEHIFYFSLTALENCFRRHDLIIIDVERLAIHGGSLRIYASPSGPSAKHSERVERLLADEVTWGVYQEGPYREFAGKVDALKRSLRGLLNGLKRTGHRIAAYGASAKGSTLLNYCNIGRDVLDFVVDRNPVKQGHYTPGSHLLIYEPKKLVEEMPAYTLLLTWNFADEILAQQMEYRRRGGRFITPIPEPRVA